MVYDVKIVKGTDIEEDIEGYLDDGYSIAGTTTNPHTGRLIVIMTKNS